jgi:hypothetical protein
MGDQIEIIFSLLFTLGSFMKITKVAQIFLPTFSTEK